MFILNFQNAIDIVFWDKSLQNKLPQYLHHFDAWKLGTMVPALKITAKRAVLDFINEVDEYSLEIISAHIGQAVSIDRLPYNLVKNLNIPISLLEEALADFEGYHVCFTINSETASVTLWR